MFHLYLPSPSLRLRREELEALLQRKRAEEEELEAAAQRARASALALEEEARRQGLALEEARKRAEEEERLRLQVKQLLERHTDADLSTSNR